MIRFHAKQSLTLAAALAVPVGVTATASAATYTLTNAQDWANTSDNEQPPLADATTGTVGGQSWKTNSALTSGGGQHLIYFQGGADSNDPSVADPTGRTNPQLLFDSINGEPDNDTAYTQVRMQDISRVAWDTKRSSASSGGHWFFNVFTKNDQGGYFGHNLNFALVDDTDYNDNQWNTLESNKSSTTSSGGQEVVLYDHRHVDPPQGMSASDFPAQTLSEWADDAGNGDAPDWWDEEILYAAMGTATNYNDGQGSTFESNLDNFQFDYDTGSVSDSVSVDLQAVPEPATLGLVFLGVGVLLMGRYGRREWA